MHIIGLDNRGTNDMPFGYVYFSDEYRVGYTGGEAIAVFGDGDAWPEPTQDHLDAAAKHLHEHGVTVTGLANS